MNVRKVAFKILIAGTDITEDISPYFTDISYTDRTEGESDSIEISLDDTDGLWKTSWYPTKGDTLSAQIGYEDELLPCGTFEIDEVEISGPPDVVVIRAVAAGIKQAVRSKDSSAHEKKTLRKIAETIAEKHGFTVDGEIQNIQIDRATQNRETDLAFLKRISWKYGHVFSIREKKLTFTTIYDLEATTAVAEILKSDIISYSFRDKTSETYKAAEVSYHDPVTGKVISATEGAITADGDTAADTLKVYGKAENKGQAIAMAKAALYRANTRKIEGSVSAPGNIYLVAGNSVMVTGIGDKIDGKHFIKESNHRVSRGGGYVTDISIKKVS